MAIDVGREAPDFTLKDPDNEDVSLSSFRGERNVVLAFFPAAFSGVCTSQFTRFGEEEARYAGEGAQIIGVSVDNRHSLRAWGESLGLGDGVLLLSDFEPKGAVAKAYGVYRDDFGFAGRATFVIDTNGIVRSAQVTSTPADQPDEDEYFRALSVCNA
ncbi:MAG: redoxin domain-containing protein [Thermoleophilia bacterium]